MYLWDYKYIYIYIIILYYIIFYYILLYYIILYYYIIIYIILLYYTICRRSSVGYYSILLVSRIPLNERNVDRNPMESHWAGQFPLGLLTPILAAQNWAHLSSSPKCNM